MSQFRYGEIVGGVAAGMLGQPESKNKDKLIDMDNYRHMVDDYIKKVKGELEQESHPLDHIHRLPSNQCICTHCKEIRKTQRNAEYIASLEAQIRTLTDALDIIEIKPVTAKPDAKPESNQDEPEWMDEIWDEYHERWAQIKAVKDRTDSELNRKPVQSTPILKHLVYIITIMWGIFTTFYTVASLM